MNILSRSLALWLPILVATSGIFVFAYWGIQQEYRLSLNDPQVQIAEDGANALAAGAPPASLTRNAPSVDIAASLAPWVAVYDASGVPLESTGVLGGAPPRLPAGVFDTSTWRGSAAFGIPLSTPAGETRFTWQPEAGVRQAVVLVAVGNGKFVAAGRSMREVENRVSVLTLGAALAWGGTELGTLVAIITLLALGWL